MNNSTAVNFWIKILFIGIFLLFFQTYGKAQPAPPPGGSGGSPPCWPPSACIPINQGAVFLLMAGVVLGIKKISEKGLN